jgi:methionine-S-sulfoxide reductase
MTRQLALSLALLAGCASVASPEPDAPAVTTEAAPSEAAADGTAAASPLPEGQAEAIFAGGCFWCMETAYEGVDGVLEVLSGYTGGAEDHPTYQQVSYHKTTHFEAVRVVYDPSEVSYEQLLEIFWVNVDPTQADGQFCDRGEQYRTAIFTSDEQEIRAAEETKARAGETLGKPIVTEILPAATFWVAEEYHQDFYKKNPSRYYSYRAGCGRDRRLEQLWGDAAKH